ncbi:unnamed protein product [Brugia timori]|uniref:ABC transmembrane type-1 domain-containing protein n=1 Tax=Brugia timori TaxID=42155 RepID=A0A0R3QIP8_9BILA|nr:unnamed protein product [Brugia timori]
MTILGRSQLVQVFENAVRTFEFSFSIQQVTILIPLFLIPLTTPAGVCWYFRTLVLLTS